MRYSKNEVTSLIGILEPKKEVKIKILDIDSDTLIPIINNKCKESDHFPGCYIWRTNNLDINVTNTYKNLLYKMEVVDTNEFYYGKFTYSGYVDNNIPHDISDIKSILNEIKNENKLLLLK